MTESEAKTKWCPMVIRAANYGNRDSDGYSSDKCRCIGSACMMWRHFANKKEGYCGLAGKP